MFSRFPILSYSVPMVNLLSNFLFRSDAQGEGPIACRLAGQEDIRAGLRQVLGCDDESQIEEFLEFAAERKIDPTALWVAEDGKEILWSALPVYSPGRTALLLSAYATSSGRRKEAAGALIQELLVHCAGRGIQLVQTLLDPHERAAREIYESCGFSLMADLEYLQAPVRRPPQPPLAAGMRWVNYSAAEHPRFAQAILASYEGSLDCPALNGVRDVEDILAGHKATGNFDPKLWFLLEEQERVAGMLLLCPTPRSDSIELVYLGLPPEVRGRGVGDLLMRQALWATMQAGRSRLTLAVDAANPPALKLYYRHGMRRICGKVAMMKDLRSDGLTKE
jgi:ribosomal protein S18 acetylase RimI-like enzyme